MSGCAALHIQPQGPDTHLPLMMFRSEVLVSVSLSVPLLGLWEPRSPGAGDRLPAEQISKTQNVVMVQVVADRRVMPRAIHQLGVYRLSLNSSSRSTSFFSADNKCSQTQGPIELQELPLPCHTHFLEVWVIVEVGEDLPILL